MSLRRRMMMGLAGQPPKQDPLYTLNATAKGFFKRRTAYGHTFNYPISYGNLKGINGNTIVWNQMVSNGQGTSGVGGWSGRNTGNLSFASDGSIEVNAKVNNSTNGIFTAVNFTKDHKYYINIPCKSYTKKVNIAVTQVGGWGGAFYPATNHDGSYKGIVNAAVAGDKIVIYLLNVTSSDIDTAKNVYQPIQIFDLTQMFGAGNEPTLAEFEALYPLGNYATDAGRLIDFKGETLRSVGFNLWDEEWEVGSIDRSTGENTAHTAKIRSKNFNPISQSTTYYLYCGASSSVNWDVMLYDANRNYINYIGAINNTTFTTPENAAYFKIREAASSYGTTYKNDICINLSNTSLNGTYKPYSAQDITINPTAMYGYLNGEGEAVRPFENGMRSAGSVFDEVYKEDGKWYAKVNVGSVDLGTLSWTYREHTGGACFYATYRDRHHLGYGICTKYSVIARAGNVNPAAMVDKSIIMNGYFAADTINVKDTAYTDAATFKSAMAEQGVMLNYELATPRTYLLTDEWQQILNTAYQVETGGMEIILPENGSEPYTSPAKVSVDYNSVNNRRRSGLPYNPIGPYNGHAYVDLGLPSGTKWATMNVGANSETDAGLYFALGETKGYADASTKAFSWSDYKFNPSGDGSTFTKYNETDGKTVLDLEDDAAHVNWGGDWHMPTKEQCEELFNTAYVTNAWVENYQDSGVNGRLFTSVSNGNTMFVPAAGYYKDGEVYSVSSISYGWASALKSNLIFYAWNSFFDIYGTGVNINKRHNGQSIRGVVG